MLIKRAKSKYLLIKTLLILLLVYFAQDFWKCSPVCKLPGDVIDGGHAFIERCCEICLFKCFFFLTAFLFSSNLAPINVGLFYLIISNIATNVLRHFTGKKN